MNDMVKILNFGVVDSVGDVFGQGQFEIPKKIRIAINFDKSKILGECQVVEDDEGLYAIIPQNIMKELSGKYPSVGFSIVEKK